MKKILLYYKLSIYIFCIIINQLNVFEFISLKKTQNGLEVFLEFWDRLTRNVIIGIFDIQG